MANFEKNPNADNPVELISDFTDKIAEHSASVKPNECKYVNMSGLLGGESFRNYVMIAAALVQNIDNEVFVHLMMPFVDNRFSIGKTPIDIAKAKKTIADKLRIVTGNNIVQDTEYQIEHPLQDGLCSALLTY